MPISKRAVLAAIAISVLVAGCGGAVGSPQADGTATSAEGSAAPSETSATQRSEGGEVTVDATWTGPAAGAAFAIKLDTHWVDLDALDLADAVLRNDLGATLAARPWDAPKGGHHREGVLSFDGDAAGFFRNARWIELVVHGVGGVPERVLRWDVAP